MKNAFSIALTCLFLSSSLSGQIISVPNLGTTYVDQNAGGGNWALLGYGVDGKLGSLLNAASGSVDTDRQGSVTLNSVNFAQQAKNFAISWNQTGFSTGGISSYDHAVSFSFSEASSFTFTAASSPPTGTGSTHWSKVSTESSTVLVNVEVLTGTPNLPSQMYLRSLKPLGPTTEIPMAWSIRHPITNLIGHPMDNPSKLSTLGSMVMDTLQREREELEMATHLRLWLYGR